MPNAPATTAVPQGGVCLTTGAAATSTFSIQNFGNEVEVLPAATTAVPTDWAGCRRIAPGDGWYDVTIAQMWPGVTHTHLHARANLGSTVSFASA